MLLHLNRRKSKGKYFSSFVSLFLAAEHICILGNGLELACNGGSCISLSWKLVPVQNQEYELNDLFLCSRTELTVSGMTSNQVKKSRVKS